MSILLWAAIYSIYMTIEIGAEVWEATNDSKSR